MSGHIFLIEVGTGTVSLHEPATCSHRSKISNNNRRGQGRESVKVLVSKDRATRMVSAHVVPLKGAVLDWVIQQCARDLERLGDRLSASVWNSRCPDDVTRSSPEDTVGHEIQGVCYSPRVFQHETRYPRLVLCLGSWVSIQCRPRVSSTSVDIEEILSNARHGDFRIFVVRYILLPTRIVRPRFKLAIGLGVAWTGDAGIFQGCSLRMVFDCSILCPWCRHLESLKGVTPQLYADIISNAAPTIRILGIASAQKTFHYVEAVGQEASPN